MSFEEFKQTFKKRGLTLPRLRQRIVKCFGALYWQDIPEAEFNAVLDSLYIDLGKSAKPLKSE